MTPDTLFTGWRRWLSVGVLALAAWLVLPSLAPAETVVFRTDTKVPLIVQGACVVNGKVKRDQPILVQPGGTAKIVLPGDKLINVYDAKENLLFQGTVTSSKDDLYYSMQPDPAAPNKLKIDKYKP